MIGRGDYHWQHEPAGMPSARARRAIGRAARNQTTVWQIPHRRNDSGHGTEKPVECMKRPIENNCSPGQAVYEPFSGSGTTIIAAEMTGRSCHAIELNPAYVDVAVRRWQAFTGEQALLGADRRSFNAVADERLGAKLHEQEKMWRFPNGARLNRRVSGVGAIGGWDQVRSRLKGDGEGNPLLIVFSTCASTIRTVPMMQHDPDRPEDLQTDSDDHVVDEIRYACMSRPYIRPAPLVKSNLIEFRRPTLNDLLADYDRSRGQVERI